uniref:Uncharacterized protein n=1 Tax=viral metagenome TaxID=1070528 RepID=A0A6C0KC35_9ZZZZ
MAARIRKDNLTIYNQVFPEKGLYYNARKYPDTRIVNTHRSHSDMVARLNGLEKKVIRLCSNWPVTRQRPAARAVLEANPWLNAGMLLLLQHHGKEGSLAEIPDNHRFDGLNYPYGVYRCSTANMCGIQSSESMSPEIGVDGRLRAQRRVIYLKLHQNQTAMEALLIHELAHTVANDVTYRTEHSNYFYQAEKLLKVLWKIEN